MELILSRPGVFNTFTTEWERKWVPAVMTYCTALKRKEVVDLISNHKRSANSSSKPSNTMLFVLYLEYIIR